jgi:hypothetical protein
MKLLLLVHVLAYPVLVWLIWVWLGIAESSTAAVAGSAVLGVAVVAAVAWLLATAFEGSLRVHAAWARSLVFVVLAIALIGVAVWLAGYRPVVTAWIAAKYSGVRGTTLNPRRFDTAYLATLWTMFGIIVALLLPPHFIRTSRTIRNWRYWAACIALAVVAGYAPWKLVTWVPAAKTLAAQAASMAARFALAYLITVAALLVFASIVRRLGLPHSPSSTT